MGENCGYPIQRKYLCEDLFFFSCDFVVFTFLINQTIWPTEAIQIVMTLSVFQCYLLNGLFLLAALPLVLGHYPKHPSYHRHKKNHSGNARHAIHVVMGQHPDYWLTAEDPSSSAGELRPN